MVKRFLSAALAAVLLLGAAAMVSAAGTGDVQILACEKADLDKADMVFSDKNVVENNLDTKDKKAGAASIAMGVKAGSKNNYCDLQVRGLNIDIGSTFTDLNIEFWFYVNDINNLSKNSGECLIELGSGDSFDKERVLWDLGVLAQANNLRSGWNKLVLPVGAANIQAVKFRELSWFRFVCYQTNGDLIVKLDDVKFAQNVPSTDPLLFDAESYNPYLYIVHTDGNIKYPVLDTDAKQGKYSIAAVTKGGGANLPAMLMTHAGLPAPIFDFGDVSNKAVEAWIYISDVKYLAESRIEFGSSGSDMRNVYWFWLHGEYTSNNKQVTVRKLKTGWNKIVVPFSEAMVKGSPKTNKINWVRIYGVGTGEDGVPLTFKFDDVKIVDVKGGSTTQNSAVSRPDSSSTASSGSNSGNSQNSQNNQNNNANSSASRPDTSGDVLSDVSDNMPESSDAADPSADDGSTEPSNDAAVSAEGSDGKPVDNDPQKSNKTGLIVAVVIVAVVLLAALAVGGVLLMKKQGKPDAPHDPDGGSDPQ